MTKPTATPKPGDRVKYAARFLRSISCFTGPLPFARGTVTALVDLGGSTTLADVDWDHPDVPARVNVRNLAPAARPDVD